MRCMWVTAVLALVAVASALPVKEEPAKITQYEIEHSPDGPYAYKVETDDGTKRNEQATLKQVVNEKNEQHPVLTVRGSFSYIDPEGNLQEIQYEADENGYRPSGPSIPKAL